jgi:hypothetical protein
MALGERCGGRYIMSTGRLFSLWENPQPGQLAPTVPAFLRQLDGPTIIKVQGRDNTRCRVVVTLLHGNEPSGLKAVHYLLCGGFVPEVTTLIAIVSTAAALADPLFSYRFLPNQWDMNRFFRPPYEGSQGALARALLDVIREAKPEAIIDIHNTSGDGPAFSVCIGEHKRYLDLAALFAHRLIITHHRLGALMEVPDLGCPILTVECGGSMQFESDAIALHGLELFLTRAQLYQSVEVQEIDIYHHPVRLEINQGVQLCYANERQSHVDITVSSDIDRHNFGVVKPGTSLAWLGSGGINSLCVRDEQGDNVTNDFFMVKDNKLYPRTTLKLFMATTNPKIATSDCLFYAVKEIDHQWDKTADDIRGWKY